MRKSCDEADESPQVLTLSAGFSVPANNILMRKGEAQIAKRTIVKASGGGGVEVAKLPDKDELIVSGLEDSLCIEHQLRLRNCQRQRPALGQQI